MSLNTLLEELLSTTHRKKPVNKNTDTHFAHPDAAAKMHSIFKAMWFMRKKKEAAR